MAEYELPPLRIKIVGDGRSFQKTVDAGVKAAKDGAEEIDKIQKDSVKSGKANQKDVERETKRHWNRLVKSAEDGYRNMGRLTPFGKSVAKSGKEKRQGANSPFSQLIKDAKKGTKEVEKLNKEIDTLNRKEAKMWVKSGMAKSAKDSQIGLDSFGRAVVSTARKHKDKRQGDSSPFANLVKNAEKEAKGAQRAAEKEQSDWKKRFDERVALRKEEDAYYRKQVKDADSSLAKQAKNAEKEAKKHHKSLESGRKKIASLDAAIHQGVFQANQKVEASQKRQIAAARQAAAVTSTARISAARQVMQGSRASRAPGSARRTSGSSGRGDGGMGFLGDRADIYMHINAVRNLASVWRAPLKALTEYQTRVAGLAPQLGGMGQAESFLKGMRGTTTGQVYGAEIPTAATRLLGANVDLQTTKELLASIGDIAGGDAERFQGLARAFSQVAAQGNLQGDELEQLAEQNFPLLQLMSQRTGIAQDVLREKMAKRQITAAAVFATVKAETAQGGKYAGMLNSLSNTLGVAVQRVRAFYDALQVEVMKTVADQLVKYVNKLASGIVHVTNWVSANQDVVKSYVELALKVSAGIVLFHAIGLAVAMVSWQMHALRRILSLLYIVTMAYNGAKRILIATYFLLRGAVMATVASMFICRAVMAGLVFTSYAFSAGIAFLTMSVWSYTMTTRAAAIATQIYGMTIARSAILSRAAAVMATVLNGTLQVIRGTLTALRIGAILAWLSFLWPVAAVIAGIFAIVGVITIAKNSMGPGGLMGAVWGAWDAMKQFAIDTIGFFMNIGHNSQVLAKYIYENFWKMVQDLGVVLLRFITNYISDMALSYQTMAKMLAAVIGWIIANAPTWGYNIVTGLWKGFVWLFGKIKDGFTMVWDYIWGGELSANYDSFMKDLGEAGAKGYVDGLVPALTDIHKDHQKKSALLNNWGDMNLQSPAIEGLKFDWQTPDMLGLADKIPDVDFGGGAIPGQDGTDIAGLFGAEKAGAGAGKSKSTAGTPMAVRAGSAEFIDAWDSIRMAQGDPSATANAQIAANTGQTNVILNQIKQSMTKPSSNWTINAGPALP
jgi:tape measure domain-containing protein